MFLEKKYEQISSPEKLDTPPSIVTPWQWGLLLTLMGVGAYLILWSVMGSVMQQLHFTGIIVDQNIPTVQIYLSPSISQQIQKGQRAFIRLSHSSSRRVFQGSVETTTRFPQSRHQLEKNLVYGPWANILLPKDIPYYPALIKLDASHEQIVTGMLVRVSVVTKKQRPIAMAFPFMKNFP